MAALGLNVIFVILIKEYRFSKNKNENKTNKIRVNKNGFNFLFYNIKE